MRYSFLVNLCKIIEIGEYLQKSLQKVYGHVFYVPRCIFASDALYCCSAVEVALALVRLRNI